MKNLTKKDWLVFFTTYFLIFILYTLISPKVGHSSDAGCWKDWMKYGYINGFRNVYKAGTDYLPLYHYVLNAFARFQGSEAKIDQYWYLLKSITLVFEMAVGYFIFKHKYDQSQNFEKSLLYSLFYVLNILVLYNSVIWGQVDGIFSCFILYAVFYAYHKKTILSLLMYLIALNFKLQAIVFFPLIGLLLLPNLFIKVELKNTIKAIVLVIILQLLIVFPFLYSGTIKLVLGSVLGSFNSYPKVSMNAFNFWYLIFHENLMEVSDVIKFAGLTYKNWGLLLFFTSSFFVLLPLLKDVFFAVFKKIESTFSLEKTIITAALIPLLFFYFNTEMHERYSHPTYCFMAVLGIIYNKPFAYILGSIAYFLNLESVLKYLDVPKYTTIIFEPYFSSILFLIVIISLFFELYNVSLFSKKIKTL